LEVTGDILILTGDIDYLQEEGNYSHPFWGWASTNYKEVLVAIGNHELYKGYDINRLKITPSPLLIFVSLILLHWKMIAYL
jgi:hypothetical protein